MKPDPRCFGHFGPDLAVCGVCYAQGRCAGRTPRFASPAPGLPVVSASGDLPAEDFNLGFTLYSGQVFRWGRDADGWWKGVAYDTAFHLRQEGDRLRFHASAHEVATYAGLMPADAFLTWYLRIGEPPRVVVPRGDRHLRRARGGLRGFRFARQAPFECIVSYVLSVQARMGLTRQRINRLARLLGREVRFRGERTWTFPAPPDLARLNEPYYRHLRFGWRSKFLPVTIGIAEEAAASAGGSASDLGLEGWRQVVDRLHETPNSGVGLKVKKCIDLFSLERLGAVPVDTWVRKMAADWYGVEGTDGAITKWAENRGRKWAGYWNEYLFAYYRELNATSLDDRVISFCASNAPSAELPFERLSGGGGAGEGESG